MYRASFMSIKVVIDLHPSHPVVTDNIQQHAWGIRRWVHHWKTSCNEGIWVHPVPCLQIPSFHCPQEEKLVQTVSLFFSWLSGLGCCLVDVRHSSERTNYFGYQRELWNDYLCLLSPRKRKDTSWKRRSKNTFFNRWYFITFIWNTTQIFIRGLVNKLLISFFSVINMVVKKVCRKYRIQPMCYFKDAKSRGCPLPSKNSPLLCWSKSRRKTDWNGVLHLNWL